MNTEPRIECTELSKEPYELADFADGQCFVHTEEDEWGEFTQKRYMMCIGGEDITQTPYTNMRCCIDLEVGEMVWLPDYHRYLPMAFKYTGLGEV